MIRALSHDKKGNVFVAKEHDLEWNIIEYPSVYEPLLNILKSIPYADYQRLFPYPNGKGNSAIQRVIRINGLEDSIHVASPNETSIFISRFVEDYWLNPYHKGSFTDYAKHTFQHFSITKRVELDNIICEFGKSNFTYSKLYQRLPLVNILALTFSKGIDIEEYMIKHNPIIPRNTGIVYTNAYFFDNGRKVHVVLPTNNPSQKKNGVLKAFHKNLFVTRGFLNGHFDRKFEYHTLEVRNKTIINHEKQ